MKTTKAAGTLTFALISAYAQQFDLVSIHPSSGTTQNFNIYAMPGGRLVGENVTLQTLIRVAYNLSNVQIVGGPSWIASERFGVLAKTEGSSARFLKEMRGEIREMLADRFHLKVHDDTRQMYAGALVPVRSGLKMTASEDGDGILHTSKRQMYGAHIQMDNLAKGLSDVTGKLVVDWTGYAGYFDIRMAWLPEGEETKEDSPPSLAAVLAAQYGLEIRYQRMQAPVVVIDSAEKPGPN